MVVSNPLRLDRSRQGLIHPDGSLAKLRPQSLQVFEFLLQHPHEIISRERLHQAVWGGMSVTDDSLSQCIRDIRRALGDESRHLLQTVPKKGYRLVINDGEDVPAIVVFAAEESTGPNSESPESVSAQRFSLTEYAQSIGLRKFNASAIRQSTLMLMVLFCVVGVGLFYWAFTRPDTTPFAGSPSVVVLPFDNANDLPDQRYLSDGISEDIVTALNRFSDMRVMSWDAVSRMSASMEAIDRVVSHPSVRYLVTGSVRRSGDKIRITVRLTDTRADQLVWAERYEEPVADVFAIQDKIATRVATTVSSTVSRREPGLVVNKPETQFQAYDFMLRGRFELRFRTKKRNFQARKYFEQAIAFNPTLDSAYIGIALTYIEEVLLGWTEWPVRAVELAKSNLYKAIEYNELNARAQSELALVYLILGEHDLSDAAIARALEINPNSPKSRAQKGYNELWTGSPEDAIEHIVFALEYDPYNPIGLNNLGVSYFMTGQYKQAAATLEQAQSVQTEAGAYSRIFLTAVYADLNETEKATESASKIRSYYPFFEVDNYINHAPMLATAEMRDKLRNSLKKAGLE